MYNQQDNLQIIYESTNAYQGTLIYLYTNALPVLLIVNRSIAFYLYL